MPPDISQHEFNEFTRLFSRTLFGTGVRSRMLLRQSFSIYYGTAYMLEHERVDVQTGSGGAPKVRSHRWSNYLTVRWNISGTANLVNTVFAQPRFDYFDDFRILNESELQSRISERLLLALSLSLRHDSVPPLGVKMTDLEIRNSITISF